MPAPKNGAIFIAGYSPEKGGESRPGQEIILNPYKGYLIVITAIADNTILSFAHEYYEVANA